MHIARKPKIYFQNFAKTRGTNCPVRWNLYIKGLYSSSNNCFLYNNLYDITFMLYNILKLRIFCLGIKVLVSYLWMTYMMIGRICSLLNTSITQITLSPFALYQTSFGYTSSKLLSIKVRQNHKLNKINLKPLTIHNETYQKLV